MEKNDEYIKLLYSNLPVKTQEKNIKMLANNFKYNNRMFLQKGEKGAWENEAKVLYYRGYPKIIDVLPGLFEWLQDINWPGSNVVMCILSKLPKEVLISELEQASHKAYTTNDLGWLYWLREFMEKNNLTESDFNNKDIYVLLKKSIEM